MKKVPVLLVAVLVLQPPGVLQADGGAVRVSKQIEHYRITVFTSPVPLRGGPVDVSVFVQDTATGGPVSGARITVRVSPRWLPERAITRQATTEAATNKVFQAAVFDLTESGLWDVRIFIEGLSDPIEVQFQMGLSDALPRVWELAPWISCPAVVVTLFCVHKCLVERRERRSRRIKKGGSHNREPALVTLSPNQRNSV
jgi:hypothetical protein